MNPAARLQAFALKPRLEQFGADCDRILMIDESDKALSLSDELIETAIVSADAALAVIDPVQAYCNGSDFHGVNGASARRSRCCALPVRQAGVKEN
jgi:hypothetical protein